MLREKGSVGGGLWPDVCSEHSRIVLALEGGLGGVEATLLKQGSGLLFASYTAWTRFNLCALINVEIESWRVGRWWHLRRGKKTVIIKKRIPSSTDVFYLVQRRCWCHLADSACGFFFSGSVELTNQHTPTWLGGQLLLPLPPESHKYLERLVPPCPPCV